MRLLRKLAIKFAIMVIMVGLMGTAFRFAKPYLMKTAGVPEGMPGTGGLAAPSFSSEESDLMGTVFKSALRLFSGTAKRDELSGELSSKLYGGQEGAATRAELGIQMERPDGKPVDLAAAAKAQADAAKRAEDASHAGAPTDAKQVNAKSGDSPAQTAANKLRAAALGGIWERIKANPELALVPIVILGMLVVHLFRRRGSLDDEYVLPDLSKLIPSDGELYEMKNAVQSLPSEDFEMLVAAIYQRQGYRVKMSAGLSGGRGGDFMLQRKQEKLLVQCKKLNPDHKVQVDRVRELQEAAAAAGATRGMYVASCGYSWDARNFGNAKGVTLINARTLDVLITEAFQKSGENFLHVSRWAPKLMSKVKLTPPLCPACEAAMEQVSVSNGSVWVCSQRPECRGRRSARKDYKAIADEPGSKAAEPVAMGGRSRTVCRST